MRRAVRAGRALSRRITLSLAVPFTVPNLFAFFPLLPVILTLGCARFLGAMAQAVIWRASVRHGRNAHVLTHPPRKLPRLEEGMAMALSVESDRSLRL